MKTILNHILVAAAVFLTVGLQPAIAAGPDEDVSVMRCGDQLIAIGDRQFTIAEKCGDPDEIQRESYAPYAQEIWVYNFGPREFVHYLTFRGGELRRIRVGGYGW